LERPAANVDPTGKFAVSINFERLFDFRPGYGYACRTDPYKEANHPADDGIFLVDLESGTSRLVLSLQQIWDITHAHFRGEDQKLLINHITFNTDGSRIVFLVRNFPKAGGMWETAVMTANRDGSDVFLLSDYSYASHYHWRDRERIAFHSRGRAGDQLYVLKDKTHEAEVIDETFFLKDGHCSYSPNRRYMLYDNYPDDEHYRSLYLYDLKEKRGIKLGAYYSMPELEGDIRCDLHPRWNRHGTGISFDSTHEGRRHVYSLDLRRFLE
jgi:Tol biopolymer transport system component